MSPEEAQRQFAAVKAWAALSSEEKGHKQVSDFLVGEPITDKRPAPRPKPQATGLGDLTEQFLQSIGITEDRYNEVRKRFGLPPCKACPERKAWLNRVTQWWSKQP